MITSITPNIIAYQIVSGSKLFVCVCVVHNRNCTICCELLVHIVQYMLLV